MKAPFSIRHERILGDKKHEITIDVNVRQKLLYFLEDYNEVFYERSRYNFDYYQSAFEKVYEDSKRAYGLEVIEIIVDGNFVEVDVLDKYIKGAKDECILDVIELFYEYVMEHAKPAFVKDLNQLLKINHLPLRFIEGELIRLDSEFVENEILFKTGELLKVGSFDKAYEDFNDARRRLSIGDYSGSIISSNNAMESFLKKLLNKKNDNQGSLKKELTKTGLIPEYFIGFIDVFEGFLQSVFTIANKSSRHGQIELPENRNMVDEPIAGFCLNLVGVLILFISERHIMKK